MIKKNILYALLLITSIAYSQNSPVGHLTIFSEDGDKFTLILNGEVINNIPQTNLRVEDLNQPYYNAKIHFENKELTDISKNSLMITDANGTYADVTYKIKRDKNNNTKMKLNYFSSIPVQQGFIPPQNVYVVHYGQPPVVNQPAPQNHPSQNNGSSMNMSVKTEEIGINVNVNIKDDANNNNHMGNNHNNHMDNNNHNDNHKKPAPEHYIMQGYNGPIGCAWPMSQDDFASAKNSIDSKSFEDSKLNIAKQIFNTNCLLSSQVKEIMLLFSFEETRLDFAKFAYGRTHDIGNYYKVNDAFQFESSIDDLNNFINSQHH
ncbi:MAG: hypothetical protein A2X12_02165 [Bacteroidetes bacterium GWE2_29_8]|nr:MAG: hypothetical protein A2X12_02165 [Bacteroidetes bacterium GWE2_29_8]